MWTPNNKLYAFSCNDLHPSERQNGVLINKAMCEGRQEMKGQRPGKGRLNPLKGAKFKYSYLRTDILLRRMDPQLSPSPTSGTRTIVGTALSQGHGWVVRSGGRRGGALAGTLPGHAAGLGEEEDREIRASAPPAPDFPDAGLTAAAAAAAALLEAASPGPPPARVLLG